MYLIFSYDDTDFGPFTSVYMGKYKFLYEYNVTDDCWKNNQKEKKSLDEKGYYIYSPDDYFFGRFIIDTEFKHKDQSIIQLIRDFKLNQLC